METTTKFNMTHREARLVVRMGQALETNRLNPLAPTFTCQTLAAAIDGLPGVMIRPNQREIGGILDRMGVSMTIRNYRRNTEKLVEVLPEWKAEAERVLSRGLRLLLVSGAQALVLVSLNALPLPSTYGASAQSKLSQSKIRTQDGRYSPAP